MADLDEAGLHTGMAREPTGRRVATFQELADGPVGLVALSCQKRRGKKPPELQPRASARQLPGRPHVKPDSQISRKLAFWSPSSARPRILKVCALGVSARDSRYTIATSRSSPAESASRPITYKTAHLNNFRPFCAAADRFNAASEQNGLGCERQSRWHVRSATLETRVRQVQKLWPSWVRVVRAWADPGLMALGAQVFMFLIQGQTQNGAVHR